MTPAITKPRPIEPMLIRFEFRGLRELTLAGFNHQNVVSDVQFEKAEEGLRVVVDGIFGMEARFVCSSAAVIGVAEKPRRDTLTP